MTLKPGEMVVTTKGLIREAEVCWRYEWRARVGPIALQQLALAAVAESSLPVAEVAGPDVEVQEWYAEGSPDHWFGAPRLAKIGRQHDVA